jgi:hypothetical protein
VRKKLIPAKGTKSLHTLITRNFSKCASQQNGAGGIGSLMFGAERNRITWQYVRMQHDDEDFFLKRARNLEWHQQNVNVFDDGSMILTPKVLITLTASHSEPVFKAVQLNFFPAPLAYM